MLPLGEVDDPACLLVAGHLEGRPFLPKSLGHGLEEPVMVRRGLHHDHPILRAPGLLEGGVGTTTGALFRPLQHPIHRSALPLTAAR